MTTSIPSRHINRMFPYEFYADFFHAFQEYIPDFETFKVKLAIDYLPNEKERYLDEINEPHRKKLLEQMRKINDIDIDFPVYFLMPYVSKTSVEANNPNNAWLFVQYFYKDQPLFTFDQSVHLYRNFPTIHLSDPNLLIGIYDFDQPPSRAVALLKAPETILEKLHEEGQFYES